MNTALDRYADLSDKLYELTVQRKLSWEEDPFGLSLVCAVGGFHVSIDLTETSSGSPCVIVRILSNDSSSLDSFSDDDLAERRPANLSHQNYWQLLSDLHNQARRQVNGADDALNAILRDLDSKINPS